MSGLVEMKMDEVNDLMVEGLKRVKRQTNADRIRSMSIDKIIEWFCRGRHCGSCPYGGVECGIRDWLESPAENPQNSEKCGGES